MVQADYWTSFHKVFVCELLKNITKGLVGSFSLVDVEAVDSSVSIDILKI